ncbi:hypothetical protein SDC9_167096 [bioreactor metagenome]|uniref:Uncharacterized protein n=1 Tax=bioreactor metagenome TaxID=1076179 RepID=A0A645G6K0_9ZZZZ
MAEQFGLDQFGRNGRAIDRHERSVGTLAHAVQGAGGHFLAGARFAAEQHRGRSRRDATQAVANPEHDLGLPDYPLHIGGVGTDLAAQDEILASQLRMLETALDRVERLGQRKRLEQEIRRAGTQRIDGRVEIGVGSHHHHVAGKAVLT